MPPETSKNNRIEFELGWMGGLDVDQFKQIGDQVFKRVAGQYKNAALHTFAINLVWEI